MRLLSNTKTGAGGKQFGESKKFFSELSKNIKKDIPKGDVLILGDMRNGAQEGDWKGKWLGSDLTKEMYYSAALIAAIAPSDTAVAT